MRTASAIGAGPCSTKVPRPTWTVVAVPITTLFAASAAGPWRGRPVGARAGRGRVIGHGSPSPCLRASLALDAPVRRRRHVSQVVFAHFPMGRCVRIRSGSRFPCAGAGCSNPRPPHRAQSAPHTAPRPVVEAAERAASRSGGSARGRRRPSRSRWFSRCFTLRAARAARRLRRSAHERRPTQHTPVHAEASRRTNPAGERSTICDRIPARASPRPRCSAAGRPERTSSRSTRGGGQDAHNASPSSSASR